VNATASSQRRFDRRFYLGGSIIFCALVFGAFARTYFLKNIFATPALTQLVHIHGVVMTGWAALLVAQTCLVVGHRIRWHRRLGTFGGLWAVLVVIMGCVATLHAAAREVREHSQIAAFQVSILGLELLQMSLFAIFVVTAIWLRHRTDYHKRLMLLTAACMLPSVISRLPLNIHGLQSIFLYLAGIVLLVVGVDTLRNRRLHPAFGWGASLLLVVIGLGVIASTSDRWIRLGTALVS
jgi:hypothetical protein